MVSLKTWYSPLSVGKERFLLHLLNSGFAGRSLGWTCPVPGDVDCAPSLKSVV